MRANTTKEVVIFMYLKGEAVKHINAGFSPIFMSFHFFDTKRRMPDILCKQQYLFVKLFLSSFWKFLIVAFKEVCAKNPHFLRSARSSFTLLKDLTRPSAMALSALASAFFQS